MQAYFICYDFQNMLKFPRILSRSGPILPWRQSRSVLAGASSRSMQLNYIPVTVFSSTDLFLDRIYIEWDSRGSAITNHKKLIDVIASLDRNCLCSTEEKVYYK